MVVVRTCQMFTLSIVILTGTHLVSSEDQTAPPPIPTKAVSDVIIRSIKADGRSMVSAYSPTGVVYVYTIIRDKANVTREKVEHEKMAALQAYLMEKIQWGDEEPPGGWMKPSWLVTLPPSQRPARSAMLSPRDKRRAWIEKRKAEGEKHFKTVYGHLKFIPKPGSEAEKEFVKRTAPVMEQISKELADDNAPWMQEVKGSPFVRSV